VAVLEAWILATTVAGLEPQKPPEAEPPPVELLEFLGDWGRDEARLIDHYRLPARPAGTEVKKDAADKRQKN
jgi:hypothetical protein